MKLPRKNALEWTVFACALLLVLATLGFLAREAARAGGGPPDLQVRLGVPVPAAEGFLVPVEVFNPTATTAAGVVVGVTLSAGGVERERAELPMDFLPKQSRRSGWVVFRTDPRRATLTVTLGYAPP